MNLRLSGQPQVAAELNHPRGSSSKMEPGDIIQALNQAVPKTSAFFACFSYARQSIPFLTWTYLGWICCQLQLK